MRKLFAIILAVLAFTAASAQNGTTTPYSRFGYGILGDNATSTQQALGGVGYAMSSGRQINAMNPASYARIDSLTFLFDMGLDLSNVWRSETSADGDHASLSQFGGGLSYITLQFPVSRRIGMSAGLLPFSSVGYAFGNGIDNGTTSHHGSGSINQFYLGISGRLLKGLSIGVNAAYLFGSTVNDTYATSESGSISLYESEITVRDFRITAGLQYSFTAGKNDFTIGAVFTPGKQLLGDYTLYKQDMTAQSYLTQVEKSHLRHSYSLPDTYGLGINTLLSRRLMLEADFTYQPWSKCRYAGDKDALADRYRIGLGAQFQPTLRGSYFRRAQYRAGIFYDRDYLIVRSNNVREYGATLGIGLPVPNFKSVVNIGIGWLHRQAYPAALVKENYLNITLGINFNEMWFRKARIY